MDRIQYIACDNSECQWNKAGRCSLDTINLRRIRNNGQHMLPSSELACLNFFRIPKQEISSQMEFVCQ